MSDTNHAFVKSDLTFAKIVATPTLNSWSQAYNAGNLFAVLSISKNESKEEIESLNTSGKEILNSLEEEYFTLETKNLASIKQAILNTLEKIPNSFSTCLVVSSIINNAIYLFLQDGGKAIIKRGEKFGVITGSKEEEKGLVSFSGFLENEDIIVLETTQFAKTINNETLSSSIDHNQPSEIAESLSPKVHQEEEGGATAIIISYNQSPAKSLIEEQTDSEKALTQEKQSEKTKSLAQLNRIKKYLSFITLFFEKTKGIIKIKSFGSSLNHSRRVFLTIAIVLVAVLTISVYFAIQKKDEVKIKALFEQVYPEAQKKYNEGQSLVGLNGNLARDDFKEAQKILEEGKSKFKPNSKEEKQILDLLNQVNTAISEASNAYSVEAKPVDVKENLFLNTIFSKNASFAVQDEKNIYFVTSDGISSLVKKTEKDKQILKKQDSWTNPGGLGVYNGNLYLLDTKLSSILKFVNTGAGYSKANYFASGITPDLSRAVSLAIDSSIYVLFKDGVIQKYTKGKADDFKVTGLDQPLSNPQRIFTNIDTKNIYILDNGNGRIVVLNKDGSYSQQYQSKIFRDSKDFEVLEKEKKIYILSQNKVYKIELK